MPNRVPGIATIALLLACSAWLGPAGASDPAERDRNLRVAEALVEAFNEPDAEARKARLEAVFGPSERNARMATAFGMLATRHGRVRVEEVAESEPTWASVVLAGERAGDYLTLNLEFESEEGDALASVGFRPGRPAREAATPVSEATKAEILGRIADLLRAEYVLPEHRDRLADAISGWEVSRFAGITQSARLAETLTRELRELQDDRHLAVLDPAVARGRWEDPEASPEDQDEHGHDIPNQGFGKVEVLDGNVGYVEMNAFDGSPAGLERLREIVDSLGEVEALIIDLVHSRGGQPEMVIALSSYLFAEPTLLAVSVSPWMDGPQERWTRPPLSSGLSGVPVYVLTSGLTASAAESFVFGLRRNQRVTVVGETTAGAGHLADMRRLPGDFGLQLPVGRTYDPETGEGWEGVGIEPDIVVEPTAALATALARVAAGNPSPAAGAPGGGAG